MLNKLPQTADAQQQTHIISVFVDQESVCCSLECLCFSVSHKTAIMSTWDAIIPRLNLERAHFQAQSYGCWQASDAHPVGLSMAQLTSWHLVSLEVKV